MSQSAPPSIYTGFWTNWSDGRIRGLTLTLSDGSGAILTAFIATFIGLVGNELWKIFCFLAHRYRCAAEARDGLHYQHQVILRNSSTPSDAIWLLLKQIVRWKGRVKLSTTRSAAYIVFALAFLVGFAAIGIFGSAAILLAAGNDRLVQSGACGYWGQKEATAETLTVFQGKIRRDNQEAAAYARSCYVPGADTTQCKIFKAPSIKWNATQRSYCGFANEICFPDQNYGYRMDTGLINSHHILGLNTPMQDSVNYRRVTTCTNLVTQGYVRETAANTPEHRFEFAYGANNTTVFLYYVQTASVAVPYFIQAIQGSADPTSAWTPNKELNRTDADVSLIMISPNSVQFTEPCRDPAFTATSGFRELGSTYYRADYLNSFIACADQHQFCNPNSAACTPLTTANAAGANAYATEFGLTVAQKVVVDRIRWAQTLSGIAKVVAGRSIFALRASETLSDLIQGPLPNNQWELEAAYWFETGLARMQQEIMHIPTQSANLPDQLAVIPMATQKDAELCHNQKILFTGGTTSFNVLGLIMTLVLGAIVILINLTLETMLSLLSYLRRRGRFEHKSLQWKLDEKLQLQRALFEERGVKTEAYMLGTTPIVGGGSVFPSLASQYKQP